MGHVDGIAQRWQDELLEMDPRCAAFLCPISKLLMRDPVTADDGHTYERQSIESWLKDRETKDRSPMKRDKDGAFSYISDQLKPNVTMKAAIDRIRAKDCEGGIAEYFDSQSDPDLQSANTVPPPTQNPRAAASMTSDLTSMFKILDPLREELKTLANLAPPKIVVIGDESSGKSTVLDQLMHMPLFPRKQEFCTRLPIHVRLRRPDPASKEDPSVKMSVIEADAYATQGYHAQPLETPVTIAIASGYHFVQDRMNELSASSEQTGIVTDRIIVLDVLHPEVPVLDIVDLPGIVSVDVTAPGKVDDVQKVISAQIEADKAHGMTSFYLIIVPSSKPNTNCALQFIQNQGLLPKAIGVLTKADELKQPEELRAWIKGENIEDEDDGSIRTAAALGQVEIDNGWTATMLKMPKRTVIIDGNKANYYLHNQLERLEKQKADEKQFFGGADAHPVMRELYNQGLAGTGALAAKLTERYYEYCRTEWLQATLTRLFHYELQLEHDRALLGETDSEKKDTLAAEEVASTLRVGAKALTQCFVSEMLLGDGKIFPVAEEAVTGINDSELLCYEVNPKLSDLQRLLEEHVAIAAKAVETFYADELKKMLDAPIEVSLDENSPAPGPLAERFWKQAGAAGSKFVRSLFGTAIELPKECVEVHKKVIAQPIIQLGAYPGYTSAVADEVRKECVIAKEKIEEAAAAVVKQVVAPDSLYMSVQPIPPLLDHARIHAKSTHIVIKQGFDIINALQAAFLRHLPSPEELEARVKTATSLKLSNYSEDTQTAKKRRELNERLERVDKAVQGLVKALDFDETNPLDDFWLNTLKRKARNEPPPSNEERLRKNSFEEADRARRYSANPLMRNMSNEVD